MEQLPPRSAEPPTEKDAPRCPSCDMPMIKNCIPLLGYRDNWECNNPMCEDCSFDDAEVIEKLRAEVEKQSDQLAELRTENKRMQSELISIMKYANLQLAEWQGTEPLWMPSDKQVLYYIADMAKKALLGDAK